MNVEFIRKFCLLLPGATEDIKWGHDLCFSIGGKMFCVTPLEPPFNASFKVKNDEFETLSASNDIIPAPYMARAKWIMVSKPTRFNKKEWEYYIRQSYELISVKLTGKLRKELGIDR
jgi:predicted DNA-binding protein (MmcQ/YjbR family)